MTFRRTLAAALALAAALPGVALAAGTHEGGHGHGDAGHGHGGAQHGMMEIGQPATGAPGRTVEITMRETDDGRMIFEPGDLSFQPGETVRLKITNAGESEHEFVMDTMHAIAEHKALMEKFPEMEHDDPNAVRLSPGETGEILWTFGASGKFGYACLIPGHYDAGMHGPLHVN
ncbi:MAG: cupredoxin family protein [Pseudooceanicola sp.]|nr:cupredoxin family protein [Pseudooceanicola sp.]